MKLLACLACLCLTCFSECDAGPFRPWRPRPYPVPVPVPVPVVVTSEPRVFAAEPSSPNPPPDAVWVKPAATATLVCPAGKTLKVRKHKAVCR